MKTSLITAIALSFTLAAGGLALTPISASAMEENSVMVGGAAMYPSKNIIENAVNSKVHTTLVAAVKAAGLVEALQGKGPFMVFAPVNSAFAALPAGTVETLLKPENKAMLTKILTAHVVAGNLSGEELLAKASGPKGYAMKTLSGDRLVAIARGGFIYIVDEDGGSAKVTISDVNQSNGVIHVVNKVLLQK